MRRSLVKIIIFLTLFIAISVNIYGRKKSATPVIRDAELKSIEPQGDFFKQRRTPFLYYEIYKKDNLIGYCFNTKDVATEEKGYGGPIEMLVGLDKAGNIENLKVLRHNETSKYASGIIEPVFLDQFKGKGPSDGFIVGKDIDAITHATISSRAVSSTLKTSVDKMQAVIYGFKKERPITSSLNLDVDFYIVVSIITFLLVAFYLKIGLLRYVGLGISVIYFGFTKANFISMSNLASIFLWNLPDLRSNISWYLFIFSGIILTFLLGAFYCSYMCPFGGLQIFLNKIFKFNIEITQALTKDLRKIRFLLLWALTILILILNNPNVANYEPFSTVFLRRGSIVGWSIALIILILSLFHYRPFCSYFCAAGAFLDILSKWGKSILRKR